MDSKRRQFFQNCKFKLSGDLLTNGNFDIGRIPQGFRLIKQNEFNIDELKELSEDKELMPILRLETGGTGSRRHFIFTQENRQLSNYCLDDYPQIHNYGRNKAMVCILVPG